MDDGLIRAIDNTVGFMRMTAIELRRIAERAPEVADELHRIADKLDTDADELAGRAGSQSRG